VLHKCFTNRRGTGADTWQVGEAQAQTRGRQGHKRVSARALPVGRGGERPTSERPDSK
jgi:hypothetical protein